MSVTITKVDFAEYLERALELEVKQPKGRSTRKEQNAGFHGTATWAEAKRLAIEGWPEGRELVGKILSEIETRTQEIERPACLWDVTGDFVDVGAYVSGEPECMVRWEAKPDSKRVARICFNVSANCSVTCETLRWRGACVLALVDKLESSGIRAEIDMALCNEQDGQFWVVLANVKRAEEPLHLDRMAFHLTHPASLRRVMWSFCETHLELADKHHFHAGGYYGFPRKEVAQHVAGEKYDLVVPGLQFDRLGEAIAACEQMFGQVCDVTQRVYDGYTSR